MLEHTKVVWVIRTSLLKNQRHWTHNLCWNMQRLFLSNQNILPEKPQAQDSHAMLEHAKVVWVIRISLLRDQRHYLPSMLEHPRVVWVIRISLLKNQRHWTHMLCKHCLRNQNIPSDKSEALDSHTMLEYAKVVWVIRKFLLRNQRHWTHKLCWKMQKLFEWSGHFFW